jgi:uncharacterized protein (TIGR00645 family)
MKSFETAFPKVIFFSRWLQAPLYFGLILAMGVYVYEFGANLYSLISNVPKLTETDIMLRVLDLIDVVMIANLMTMVIIGGYEIFVSRLRSQAHPDHPEWLDEVNAGTMKIKLALSLVSISSIHLLRTFIDPEQKEFYTVMWQVTIHLTLVVSALVIAFSERIMHFSHAKTNSSFKD